MKRRLWTHPVKDPLAALVHGERVEGFRKTFPILKIVRLLQFALGLVPREEGGWIDAQGSEIGSAGRWQRYCQGGVATASADVAFP